MQKILKKIMLLQVMLIFIITSISYGSIVIVKEGEKDKYIYSDESIEVVAELQKADAIPNNAELRVNPIDGESYIGLLNSIKEDDISVEYSDNNTLFYDIYFEIPVEGETSWVRVEPEEGSVKVSIKFKENQLVIKNEENLEVHHFIEEENNIVVEPIQSSIVENTEDNIEFTTDSFSVYSLTYKYTNIISDYDVNYIVNVEYNSDTGIPEDAFLDVNEIEEDNEEYINTLKEQYDFNYIKLLNIDIKDNSGNILEPSNDSSVDVTVISEEIESLSNLRVIHYVEDDIEDVDYSLNNNTINFQTSSFSVYAIVDVKEPASTELRTVATLDELLANLDQGFCISESRTGSPEYMRTSLRASGAFYVSSDSNLAGEWFFEPINDGSGQYYIYTDIDGVKNYIHTATTGNSTGNNLELSTTAKDPFEIQYISDGKFRLKKGTEGRWLQYSNSGTGMRYHDTNTNGANVNLTFTYSSSRYPEYDYYKLDGKSFGIAYINDGIFATYLSEIVKSTTSMDAEIVTVRPDIINNDGYLLVSPNTTITEWMFHYVSGYQYYITTEIGGVTKYLTINNKNFSLLDEPTESSLITVLSGEGNRNGCVQLSSSENAIILKDGKQTSDFVMGSKTSDYSWLNLVEKTSDLTSDDFVVYSAEKVSISDTEKVRNKQRLIIYTRIWNPTTLAYEYYAINHDGSLVRCYDHDFEIVWVGSQVNTLIWEFTEYYYDDGTPNNYYEFQNIYSGKYLAPQMNGDVLSDNTIGVNLNGRRYGDDYTTVIAWDDPHYAYAALKVDDSGLTASNLSSATDFYVALIDNEETGQLTTIETVDNTEYGITMKMVDFNNTTVNNRDRTQTRVMGTENGGAGLVSKYLEDGYPVATLTGTSLSELFGSAYDVNHLFIDTVLKEGGYFEFDSTQNYAYLGDNTDFTVYNQLGTTEHDSLSSYHGQFFPYNSLIDSETGEPYPYSTTRTNQTTTLNETLPDSDPRKGEKMHEIPKSEVDYFFGMQMEASFTQTESGLDAWGHDIIFEFSGDDDFWLYVDDNLVLDLGGVHPAQSASINFRTGVVLQNGTTTNLYNIFKSNYESVNPEATAQDVLDYLDSIFELNENNQYVFTDYSIHTMKMFYMERGAGASNLHMKFNLAYVSPGSVILKKDLTGSVKSDYTLARFPYQIWYKTEESDEYELLKNPDIPPYRVVYNNTSDPVAYLEHYTPAGKSIVYDYVFFLRANEEMLIMFPTGTEDYYIVECGVNPNIYDEVKANREVLQGSDEDLDELYDYAIDPASIEDRPRVTYTNHVSSNVIRTLTIKKRLYDFDHTTELFREDDPTTFDFRLYLGGSDDSDLTAAYMQDYFVKNELGEYCIYNNGFESLGITSFSQLTEEQITQATFTSSANGAISKIPAGYSVEIRDLLVDTKFMVEERDYEIPVGYRLDNYYRVDGTYIIEDGDTVNSGIIRDQSDPVIEIHNFRGISINVNKVWSDSAFTDWHEDVYFGVFVGDSVTPLEGTVRKMSYNNYSLEYYWDELLENSTFEDYHVYELILTNPQMDGDTNVVASWDSLTIIDEGGYAQLQSRITDEQAIHTFAYKVNYIEGTPSGGASNVRADTVRNTRDGIKIEKRDIDGNPLAGAIFTLKNDDDMYVGPTRYTSDSDGLVTMAYLDDGDYKLTEIKSPIGYQCLEDEIDFTVLNGQIVFDEDLDMVSYDNEGSYPVLTIINQKMEIHVIKEDHVTYEPLEGAEFGIYRQVIGGNGVPRKDYFAVPGYSKLPSDENGLVLDHLEILGSGTYYIVESVTPENYKPVDHDNILTISDTGYVSLMGNPLSRLESEVDEDNTLIYTVYIGNEKEDEKYSLTVNKIVSGSMGNKAKVFNFTLSLSNDNINEGDIEYSINGGEVEDVEFTDNSFSFSLGHNDSIVFMSIPINSGYSVVEQEANKGGYTTIISGENTGEIVSDTEITFTNNRNIVIPTSIKGKSFYFGICIVCSSVLLVFILLRKKAKK